MSLALMFASSDSRVTLLVRCSIMVISIGVISVKQKRGRFQHFDVPIKHLDIERNSMNSLVDARVWRMQLIATLPAHKRNKVNTKNVACSPDGS